MSDKPDFPKGIFYQEPRPNAPEFVMGGISIQKEQLMEWLVTQEVNEKGYLNIDLLRSKEGKPYLKVNAWKPTQQHITKSDSIPEVKYESDIKASDLPW